MTERFEMMEALPGVYHIRDAMGVCCTLIVGETDTLLWDTGYGLFDLAAFIAPYVRGELHVVLSHAHHDHACGHQWFRNVRIHKDDLPLCARYTGRVNRKRQLGRALSLGLIGDGYDSKRYLSADPAAILPLQTMEYDLGGLTVRLLPVPGHTPGSLAAYIPERTLLLTADSWNPTTWLFFPDSLPLKTYTRAMQPLRELNAEHALCSHDFTLHRMDRVRAYIDGLTAETFAAAVPTPVPPYTDIHTFACHPEPGTTFVFNSDKRE